MTTPARSENGWRVMTQVTCGYCGKLFSRSREKIRRAEAMGWRQFCCPEHMSKSLHSVSDPIIPKTRKGGKPKKLITYILPTLKTRRIAAFWENVDRITTPEGCWPWIGQINRKGYGLAAMRSKKYPAHNVVFVLNGGTLLEGELVRHTCDNPACCNPTHLIAGTPADNSRDMVLRGRSRSGSKNHNAKLTENIVLSLRGDSRSARELGQLHGVNARTIRGVKKGESWKHL